MDADTRTIALELLGQLGSSREARDYVRRFSKGRASQFAVIKVGGGVLANECESLVWALGFLQQLGLLPIVIHGAGPQLDLALSQAGIEKQTIAGKRVTTPAVMAIARDVVLAQNYALVDALESRGVRARSLTSGVFEACVESDALGLVGKVSQVKLTPVKQCVSAGAIPILSCFGETREGQALNINADSATRAMALAVEPHKIIFLTPTGGLLNDAGNIISAINLVSDFATLMSQPWLHSGMRLKLQQIERLLSTLPASASVSITSAGNLTRELFTHSGSGTLIRQGERFRLETLMPAHDWLPGLIERCFDRQLRDDYLESRRGACLLYGESGRAAAVVDETGEWPYLDKFAVTPQAQGEGLGTALWSQLSDRYGRLVWRCRADNPVLGWYLRQTDWALKRSNWWALGTGEDWQGTEIQRTADDVFEGHSGWR